MSFHRLNAECVLCGERACADWETDEARAQTWGAPCYGGTEHVADKRALLFKESGSPVKCAPIRHQRLVLSLNEPGEGSLGVRPIRCLAPITLPGTILFKSHAQTVTQPAWPSLFISLREDVNKTNE